MTTKTLPVLSFAKLEQGMPMPHLLDIQTRAFASLLQPDGKGAERTDVGLERVFKDVFPIQDVNGNYSLEFVKYGLGEPKYSVEECIERDMTYSVPLKATLQLVVMEEVGETVKTKRPKNIIEKEVYLGELPILTPLGTFVINGAAREGRRRAHAGEVQHLPPRRHQQGHGVRGLHLARPARRGAADYHARAAGGVHPGVRRSGSGDRGGARRGRARDLGRAQEEAPEGRRHQGGRAAAGGAERVAAHQEHAAQGPDAHGGRSAGADLRPAAAGRGSEPRRAPAGRRAESQTAHV